MTTHQIIVRPATLEDLPILLQFEQGIVEAERPFDPTMQDGEVHHHDLPGIISATDAELVVALFDERVVGCGYVQIRDAETYVRHAQYGYVGLIFVLREYRGMGINQAIIETLKDWLRARNIFEMRLEVYDNNVRAKRAYEKTGFVPHMLVMRVDLSK